MRLYFPGKICGLLTNSISEIQLEKKKTAAGKKTGLKYNKICFFVFSSGKVQIVLTYSNANAVFLFSGTGRKKTAFLLTNSIFSKKFSKRNFAGKKIGTLGSILIRRLDIQLRFSFQGSRRSATDS